MREKFDFLIHPLTIERGFELHCEGILSDPLRFHRLFEAILAAAQIGQDLEAEIHIYNTEGQIAETLELNRNAPTELALSI